MSSISDQPNLLEPADSYRRTAAAAGLLATGF